MIAIDGTQITYEHMGLFTGDPLWRHPVIATATYELVFVHEGTVFLEEAGEKYALSRGEYLVLSPSLTHGGYRESGERVSFTWLHFFADGLEKLGIPKHGSCADPRTAEYRLRELGHMAESGERMRLEAELLSLLFFLKGAEGEGNRLCAEAAEYIRVHIAEAPTAREIADRFSYSADHLSRLFKKEYRLSLKAYIEAARVSYLKRTLLSETLSIGEIAALAGFEDGNRLSKFFKYHTGMTPGEYRAGFFLMHTNIK